MTGKRVSFLFTDYDGTLAPMDVDQSNSAIPPVLDSALRRAALRSKVAVITAKSYDLVRRSVPYAWAWGCVYGLDVRMSDGSSIVFTPAVDVLNALREAKRLVKDGATFEEKRGPLGLLGFSVDWRWSEMPDLPALVSAMQSAGMHTIHDSRDPFVDFLCAPPRKGFALRCMKEAATDSSGIAIFLGDSKADNPAFRASDIAVGVFHGQELDDLECDFITTEADLPSFLNALTGNNMRFEAGLPWLRSK